MRLVRIASFLAVILISLSPLGARAQQRGMFLCASPLIANNFWGDLISAHNLGINLTYAIASQIAAKDQCTRVDSDNLKAVRAGWGGMLALTNGRFTGWANPQYYVLYTNNLNSDF